MLDRSEFSSSKKKIISSFKGTIIFKSDGLIAILHDFLKSCPIHLFFDIRKSDATVF